MFILVLRNGGFANSLRIELPAFCSFVRCKGTTIWARSKGVFPKPMGGKP